MKGATFGAGPGEHGAAAVRTTETLKTSLPATRTPRRAGDAGSFVEDGTLRADDGDVAESLPSPTPRGRETGAVVEGLHRTQGLRHLGRNGKVFPELFPKSFTSRVPRTGGTSESFGRRLARGVGERGSHRWTRSGLSPTQDGDGARRERERTGERQGGENGPRARRPASSLLLRVRDAPQVLRGAREPGQRWRSMPSRKPRWKEGPLTTQ